MLLTVKAKIHWVPRPLRTLQRAGTKLAMVRDFDPVPTAMNNEQHPKQSRRELPFQKLARESRRHTSPNANTRRS